jgi:cytochrome c oxidase subunit 4
MTHHSDSLRTYILIWAALIVLTFTTVFVGEIELGEWNIVVAITIAIIKALLVVLFFMHIKDSSNLTRLFVVAGFFWMIILFALLLGDYGSRGWLPMGRFW